MGNNRTIKVINESLLRACREARSGVVRKEGVRCG